MDSRRSSTDLITALAAQPSPEPPDILDSHLSDLDHQELAAVSEPQARGFVSRGLAFEVNVLPLYVRYINGLKTLVAAGPEKEIIANQTRLRFAVGFEVSIVPLDGKLLREAIQKAYLGDNSTFIGSIQELRVYSEKQRSASTIALSEPIAENEIGSFISRLIEYAYAHGASDIHLMARRSGAFIQLRVNGELLDHNEVLSSPDVQRQLVSRLKVLANLDISEKRLPQDGRFSHSIAACSIDIRVSSLPTIHGENIVLRLLGRSTSLSLEGLGYDPRIVARFSQYLSGSNGVLLFSGPTGSGKTTSLYAIVEEMKRRRFAVSTIEDPVEIILDGIAQTSISPEYGLGYADALKAVLRQDPDAILIGELRELKATKVAFEAAMSGHHVLSTIHGAHVVDVLRRLESFGMDIHSVMQSLSTVITQKLVNRLCQLCKVFDLRSANAMGCDVYRAVGCSKCGYSGFNGKTLVAEGLFIDDRIREQLLISNQLHARAIRDIAENAYLSFKDQSLLALERGEICYEQYLAFH